MAEHTEPSPAPAPYRILLELGRGGMGAVFLAVSEGVGGFQKLKVIKHLRPELAEEPELVAMFLDEAKLAARLRHPNIVQTNEVGFDGHSYFIEMEYLEGQSLDSIDREHKARGPLPLDVTLRVLAEALGGLEYAHTLCDAAGEPLRVVHRDVSPHNIFVTYEGVVKVLDFGIAKAADSSTRTESGVFKGKLHYMAPEQAIKGLFPLDRRADIFSAGIILWQALAGKRFWQGVPEHEIFLALGRGDFPSPKQFRPEADDAVCAVCMKALAHDPQDRFASAAEFQEAIEGLLERTRVSGTRALKSFMQVLFEERRKQTDRFIEEQLKKGDATAILSGPGGTPNVPVLAPGSQRRTVTGVAERSGSRAYTATALTKTASAEVSPAAGVSSEKPRRRAWIVPLLVAVVLVGGASTYHFTRRPNVPQAASASSGAPAKACFTDVDCAGEAPLCGREGVCIASKGCRTNVECMSSHGGAPTICRREDGVCVAVESESCKLLAGEGEIKDDRAILIGSMFQLTGPDGNFGKEQVQAIDLARRDISQLAHGIPLPKGDQPPRPLVVVSCDESLDSKQVAQHLASELRVPAIIGFGSGQGLLDLLPSVYLPNHVLALASVNRGDMITRVPQPKDEPRLIWRLTASAGQFAGPMSKVISQVFEPEIRTAGASTEFVRVAVVRPSSAVGVALEDGLFKNLVFNGKTAVANGSAFKVIAYGDPTGATRLPRYDDTLAELLDFAPDVILFTGEPQILRYVFGPLEEKWPASRSRRPYYLSTEPPEGRDAYNFLAAAPGRRARFFGLNAPANTTANVRFTARFKEFTGNDQLTPEISPGSPYDAVYLLAYAAAAIESGAVTGPNLSRAFARLLPPGEPFDVGPSALLDGFNALRAGKNVDLHGAGTRLDLDLATGEPSVDSVVVCGKIDRKKKTLEAVEAGVTYSGVDKKLSGTLLCP